MLRIFPVAVGILALGALAACSDTMSSQNGYAHATAMNTALPVTEFCQNLPTPADQQVCEHNITEDDPNLQGDE